MNTVIGIIIIISEIAALTPVLEIPLDISDCIFIATANTLETVARPLIDRMEVISLRSYTRSEKLAIFKTIYSNSRMMISKSAIRPPNVLR